MAQTTLTSVDASLIKQVVLVDEITRQHKTKFAATSLPGHLVHVILEGHVRQESGGRVYELGPGHSVWYHEDEPVSGEILEAPWKFLTVNFLAPALSPPPFEMRVKIAEDDAIADFQQLLSAWRDTSVGATVRQMRVTSRLLDLLVMLLPHAGQSFVINPQARIWWDIEAQLRKDLAQPIDLALLQKISRRSMRTIVRASHHATGQPPMHRVKQVRLSMGRGLVLHSDLRFSEIAARIGYPRVQEFSRDYHQQYGLTPSQDRKKGPDYKRARSRAVRRRGS